MSLNINNFNNICRACSQSTNLISFHENIYLIEMLATSAQIQIQLNDELPKKICLNCIKDLNHTYEFISKCRTSDAAFRQCLIQQKLLKLRENYEKPDHSVTEEIFIKTETSDIEYNNAENEVSAPHNLTFQINSAATIEPMDQEHEESSEDEFQDSPLDASAGGLPEKSRTRYKREHILFLTYCKQHNLTEFTEDVVLEYFREKAKTMKASSLWSLYSMLKSTLMLDDSVDISKYTRVVAFLKEKNVGYKSVSSKAFTREQVNRFLQEAPDETYLMTKVAMIMGIAGGCQRDELMRMSMDDIEDKDSVLIVTVPFPNTNKSRTFLITNREFDWLSIYRRYYEYRVLLNTEHRRFFVNYKNGKFTNIPAGKNTLGRSPKVIAEYLNLAEPGLYTGHCFRRTSAMLFNKRGVWKRSAVLEGDDFL